MRKKGNCTTVAQVIEKNTGIPAGEFLKDRDYMIKNLDEGRKLLVNSIRIQKHVFVMADYDTDGVTSGCIFEMFFRGIAYNNYTIRFPKRFTEGYGIRESVVDEIPDGALLVTVDNGIAAIAPVAKAKARGLSVLIVDHHEAGNVLPDADVIIDPHATGGCTFNGYCGAGLAYKLCSPLVKDDVRMKMLTFAGIGTVADMVPLVYENHKIVREALAGFFKPGAVTAGLGALLKANNIAGYITEEDIGFYISPCINAMSRMEDDGAKGAFECLTYDGKDLDTAEELAKAMKENNDARKALQKEQGSILHKAAQSESGKDVVVVYAHGLHEGIIGLAAGDLAESYKRPAVVFTDSCGKLKGSGRSYGGVDLFALLKASSSFLGQWGGHKDAAGMSMPPENLEPFRDAMNKAFSDQGCTIVDDDGYDIDVQTGHLQDFFKECSVYAPYGMGNPPIRIRVPGFRLEFTQRANGYFSYLGKEANHVKFFSRECQAIGFYMAGKYKDAGEPKEMSLYGVMTKDHYVSQRTGKPVVLDNLRVLDFEPVEEKKQETGMHADLMSISDAFLASF